MNNYLRDQANTARHVAIALAENIYRYIGNELTLDDLKLVVDSLISPDLVTEFEHRFILKDTYQSTLSNMFIYDPENMDFPEDDTETLLIKDGD